MFKLYEVLVPTIYGDTLKPIRTRHHKKWDEHIIKITNGLTILKPCKGKWVEKATRWDERVIPVRIYCDETEIDGIVDFTIAHYRQKAVMFFVLTDKCEIRLAPK